MDMRARAAAVIALALLAGCAGQSAGPDSEPEAQRASPTAARPGCPSANGGACLGVLAAGTYTTTKFRPTLTYTVPGGWTNFEDLPGNFLLVPPDGTLDGVDAGTSDYIGVYNSAAPLKGCAPGPNTAIETTPAAIAAELSRNPGLDVTSPRPVTVGGLSGVVLDMKLKAGFQGGCDQGSGKTVVPILTGTYQASFEHAVVDGVTLRMYLLTRGPLTLGVEVDDVAGGLGLDDYSAVVETFRFSTP
jgi:hypothetical protein